ncbi:MAG: glutamate--tRNA ligase [Pseudomonadota bacterium]
MKPRVRFAPSPTGDLHIGGARTALYNWLFARHHKGEFLLRIEDTDLERSTKAFEESILNGMRWLGLDWDGDLIYQSQRTELYTKEIKRLLDEGNAYLCTCTSEELDQMRKDALSQGLKPKYDGRCRNGSTHPDRKAVVRFKAPTEGATKFDDICRGEISFENKELDDLVIARSDGSPTYNLTVVVDDAAMGITHVIRGDDHINNTPRQILLYQALGYQLPQFAHLPMIYGADKKKLSKRHGATAVFDYKDKGFLPEAMMNYLARLGWSSGDQEIFTVEELKDKFDLKDVGSSPAVFDVEKLTWVNAQHMLKYSNEEILKITKPYLTVLELSINDEAYAVKALATERERGKTLQDLAQISAFYFKDAVEFDDKSVKKWLDADGVGHLIFFLEKITTIKSFDEGEIKNLFEERMKDTNSSMLKVAQPCRVALTGTTVSPGIYEVMAIMGQDRVTSRFKRAIEHAKL